MRYVITVFLSVLLAACTSGEHEDLRIWMKEATKDLKPGIKKLPPVVPYVPVQYETEGRFDPFSVAKIEAEGSNAKKEKEEQHQRRLEARELRNSVLEKYPLESMKMIGYLRVNNQPIAVIQVEKHVKQVKMGEYIGQDFGIIIQITDREVALREVIQDSAGDWVERTSTLVLQAKEGGNK